MGSSSRSAVACGVVVAGLLAGVSTVHAAEFSYGGYMGIGHTDNIERLAVGGNAETIASVGGQLRLDHQTSRTNVNIATRLEYRDYLENTFDSEVIGNLVGSGVFDFVEERFTWTIEDTFGQMTQNQFAPVTPGNRENVNYLSTGPDITLPFLSRNRFILRGRYVDVDYEISNLGNTRIRGEVALQHDLSENSNVSLNATSEEVDFEDDLQFIDYDRNEGFLSYHANASRTSLAVDGGVTEIKSQGESNDTWLGRLELTRRISTSATLAFEVGHDYSDSGTSFVELQSLQPGSTDPVPVQQTATPFENTYALLNLRYSWHRTELLVRASFNDEVYDDQPTFDRTRVTFEANVERDLNAALEAHLGVNYSQQDYESLNRQFADKTASIGVRWNFGRYSYLSLDYQYLDRDDDLDLAKYQANEAWLRFSYMVGEDVARGAGFGGP